MKTMLSIEGSVLRAHIPRIYQIPPVLLTDMANQLRSNLITTEFVMKPVLGKGCGESPCLIGSNTIHGARYKIIWSAVTSVLNSVARVNIVEHW